MFTECHRPAKLISYPQNAPDDLVVRCVSLHPLAFHVFKACFRKAVYNDYPEKESDIPAGEGRKLCGDCIDPQNIWEHDEVPLTQKRSWFGCYGAKKSSRWWSLRLLQLATSSHAWYDENQVCSDHCRMRWWVKHPEAILKKAFYHFTYSTCGKAYGSYGKSHR